MLKMLKELMTSDFLWRLKLHVGNWNEWPVVLRTWFSVLSRGRSAWRPGADLRQKASSATLPERPFLPSLLLSPLPSHPLPSSLPSPPLEVGPLNPARGSGERWSSPAGSGAEPQPKSNLVHFSLKIWHLVATILMIFLRINWPNFVQFEH